MDTSSPSPSCTQPAPKIAIQGEAGSFSHEAALAMLPGATVVPCPLSAEVFARIVDGSVDGAVIPIENSLAGSVVEHYDLLFSHPVRIAEELLLRIRHTLIAPPGVMLDQVRRVYSHPVALAQCRRFFEQNAYIEPVPFYDTAGSVKHLMVLGDSQGEAAIASREAARVYGAAVLRENLEDNPENYTRFFLVLPREQTVGPGNLSAAGAGQLPGLASSSPTKVSLAFEVDNRPGTLVAALSVFADLGTNLTRIESRPIPGQPWHYIFYADYEIPAHDPAPLGGKAPEEAVWLLARHCSVVKELGRYPAASIPQG